MSKLKYLKAKTHCVRDFFQLFFEKDHKKHHGSMGIWELFFKLLNFQINPLYCLTSNRGTFITLSIIYENER